MIAAKATCFRIAASEAFREYQTRVRANADALAAEIMDGGVDVLTGGTDTHLLQLDLRRTEWTGKDAEERLHAVRLTTNRNTVPFDERPPTVASGVRIGTPAATMRGFEVEDFREVGRIIVGALADGADVPALAARSEALCERHPLYDRLPGVHEVRGVNGGVIEVDHPLVRHKIGLLRDVTTTTQMFRQLVNELTLLLTYEATKDLADEEVEIETPLEVMKAPPDQRQEGVRVPDPARRRGHARRRALADPGRARRVHRPLPERGDAAAGRVLREAARTTSPSAT